MGAFACISTLLAAASAAPQFLAGHGLSHGVVGHGLAHGVVGHGLGHAVAHAAPVVVYPDEVSPYTYQYAVADDYSNSNFNAAESDDGTGKRDFIFWDAVYFTTSRLQSTYYIYMMPYSIY